MITDVPFQPLLIVEDSPEDFEAVMRAFDRVGLKRTIYHCSDGEDALDLLYRRGSYAATSRAHRPILILLDLNLPGTDGHEVLKNIKCDPELRTIPVVVMTTSSDFRDIQESYVAGANSYIVKPKNFARLTEAIQRLTDYWFDAVMLPKEMGL